MTILSSIGARRVKFGAFFCIPKTLHLLIRPEVAPKQFADTEKPTSQVILPTFFKSLHEYRQSQYSVQMANISFFAIPAYWVLTLIPHNYAIAIMKKANNNRWNNSSPRSTKWDTTLRESTPAEVYARYERAEAAHKNGMENLPVFVGAVLAGNIANLSSLTLNAFVLAYLCLRIIYTLIYINVGSHRFSFFRTAVWFVSTLMCMGIFIIGGIALA